MLGILVSTSYLISLSTDTKGCQELVYLFLPSVPEGLAICAPYPNDSGDGFHAQATNVP